MYTRHGLENVGNTAKGKLCRKGELIQYIFKVTLNCLRKMQRIPITYLFV